MRVRVHKACVEQLRQVALHAHTHQPLHLVFVRVCDMLAVQPVHGEHTARAQLLVKLGYLDKWQVAD